MYFLTIALQQIALKCAPISLLTPETRWRKIGEPESKVTSPVHPSLSVQAFEADQKLIGGSTLISTGRTCSKSFHIFVIGFEVLDFTRESVFRSILTWGIALQVEITITS